MEISTAELKAKIIESLKLQDVSPEKIGDDDQNERQIKQPAALLRVSRLTKEIDDTPDHLTTPSARVRK